jgi:hypothetical protein
MTAAALRHDPDARANAGSMQRRIDSLAPGMAAVLIRQGCRLDDREACASVLSEFYLWADIELCLDAAIREARLTLARAG